MNRHERESAIARWRETSLLVETHADSLSPSTASGLVRQFHDVRMLRCRADSRPTASAGEQLGNARGLGASARAPFGDPVRRGVPRQLYGHARPSREVRQPVDGSRSVIRCYSELTY